MLCEGTLFGDLLMSMSCFCTRDRDGKYTVVPVAEFGGSGSIFATLTVLAGPLRLLGRFGRARMRWKADVAYFLVNVMKCCEIFGNVVKCCEML